MRPREARLYVRIKALCCNAWSIAPHEFEELAESDRIAAEDVIELFFLKACEPFGLQVPRYLFREKEFERRRKFEQIKILANRLQVETNEERRADLEKQIAELNK